jgi:hypothetical protein
MFPFILPPLLISAPALLDMSKGFNTQVDGGHARLSTVVLSNNASFRGSWTWTLHYDDRPRDLPRNRAAVDPWATRTRHPCQIHGRVPGQVAQGSAGDPAKSHGPCDQPVTERLPGT